MYKYINVDTNVYYVTNMLIIQVDMMNSGLKAYAEYPWLKSIWKPCHSFGSNAISRFYYIIVQMFLPGLVLDQLLWITGNVQKSLI